MSYTHRKMSKRKLDNGSGSNQKKAKIDTDTRPELAFDEKVKYKPYDCLIVSHGGYRDPYVVITHMTDSSYLMMRLQNEEKTKYYRIHEDQGIETVKISNNSLKIGCLLECPETKNETAIFKKKWYDDSVKNKGDTGLVELFLKYETFIDKLETFLYWKHKKETVESGPPPYSKDAKT